MVQCNYFAYVYVFVCPKALFSKIVFPPPSFWTSSFCGAVSACNTKSVAIPGVNLCIS